MEKVQRKFSFLFFLFLSFFSFFLSFFLFFLSFFLSFFLCFFLSFFLFLFSFFFFFFSNYFLELSCSFFPSSIPNWGWGISLTKVLISCVPSKKKKLRRREQESRREEEKASGNLATSAIIEVEFCVGGRRGSLRKRERLREMKGKEERKGRGKGEKRRNLLLTSRTILQKTTVHSQKQKKVINHKITHHNTLPRQHKRETDRKLFSSFIP